MKINKFTFDVKQLKMNRFIKSISDLIICTSNVTLEVVSLRPWKGLILDSFNTKSHATIFLAL